MVAYIDRTFHVGKASGLLRGHLLAIALIHEDIFRTGIIPDFGTRQAVLDGSNQTSLGYFHSQIQIHWWLLSTNLGRERPHERTIFFLVIILPRVQAVKTTGLCKPPPSYVRQEHLGSYEEVATYGSHCYHSSSSC